MPSTSVAEWSRRTAISSNVSSLRASTALVGSRWPTSAWWPTRVSTSGPSGRFSPGPRGGRSGAAGRSPACRAQRPHLCPIRFLRRARAGPAVRPGRADPWLGPELGGLALRPGEASYLGRAATLEGDRATAMVLLDRAMELATKNGNRVPRTPKSYSSRAMALDDPAARRQRTGRRRSDHSSRLCRPQPALVLRRCDPDHAGSRGLGRGRALRSRAGGLHPRRAASLVRRLRRPRARSCSFPSGSARRGSSD